MKNRPYRHPSILYKIIFLLAGLILASCQTKIIVPRAPDIAYGRDVCDQCGMIISEERFAAGLQLTDGKYLKFDDAGEMIKYYQRYPDIDLLAWWVHDYDSLGWIRGEDAFFVKSTSLQTPMGTGVLAFETQERAELFAEEYNGTVYNLDEIRSQVTTSK